MPSRYPDRGDHDDDVRNERSRFIHVDRRNAAGCRRRGSIPSSEAANPMLYWQRDKCHARGGSRGTGNGAHPRRGGVASARFIGAGLLFCPFFYSSSLPRARARASRRSLRGKPPAEMRRAATREWNIIARSKDSSHRRRVAQPVGHGFRSPPISFSPFASGPSRIFLSRRRERLPFSSLSCIPRKRDIVKEQHANRYL